MIDRNLGFVKTASHQAAAASLLGRDKPRDEEGGEEDYCPAFGYLRGIRERALAVEFRYRNGNSEFFPYSWLGPWRFNPSTGLLLKFTGDITTLVLIRGSNLDAMVNQGVVNLTENGFQRHRILWVREMDEQELRQVGERGPTIDRIDIAEFEKQQELNEWLKKTAPAFARLEQ